MWNGIELVAPQLPKFRICSTKPSWDDRNLELGLQQQRFAERAFPMSDEEVAARRVGKCGCAVACSYT